MAQQFSKTDQRRITFLSLLSSAAAADYGDNAYEQAERWLAQMETDGFFEEAPAARPTPASSAPRGTSRPQASSSRPSNRGRDNQDGGWSGQPLRDPDGPPSEKQVAAVLKLTGDYTEDELWSFTKQQVSDIISDLKG